MVNPVLKAGHLELELAPAIGGSIVRFDHVHAAQRQHLLRPSSADADSALGMASFPLVPYANRIRGGMFECDGVLVQLTPNMAGDQSPLHGQGWLHPWTATISDEQSATLHYLHETDEWPWRYESWQDFELDEDGLSLTLGCRNLSPQPMPCGLAQHPYFPCDNDTTIDAPVGAASTADAQTLPVERVDATGRFDLRNRKIGSAGLDNAFERWSGIADFAWLDQPKRLRMTSPDATRFHIYSPIGERYFAAEPVQNAVTALNYPQSDWHMLGIALLVHGAARELRVRFEVRDA